MNLLKEVQRLRKELDNISDKDKNFLFVNLIDGDEDSKVVVQGTDKKYVFKNRKEYEKALPELEKLYNLIIVMLPLDLMDK
jgi:hypothetical protein